MWGSLENCLQPTASLGTPWLLRKLCQNFQQDFHSHCSPPGVGQPGFMSASPSMRPVNLDKLQGLWCRSAFAVRQGGGAASSVSLSETSPRLSTRAVAQPLPALADVEVIVTARLATCFVLLRVILLCRVPALSMLYMNTAVLCESLPGWG